jgi:GNAT superfamily N-acetyltransferase
MIITNYEHKYQADVLELVTEFYNEAMKDYDTGIDIDTLKHTIDIYKDNSFLLIREDKCIGLIAGLTGHSPINNDKVYQEIIWYVSKPYRRYGVHLLYEVERLLTARGYSSIIMACLHNSMTDKLFRLYERLGYKPVETHFRRELWKS